MHYIGVVTLREKALEDILIDADFWQRQRDKLLPKIERWFRELFMVGTEAGREITPVRIKELLPLDPEEINRAADRLMATYTDEWWRQFETSTQDMLRRSIQRTRTTGAGIEGVIGDIEHIFGTERAFRIAATETTRLYGLGAQATYAAAGLDQWEWQTVEDGGVCSLCRELSRQRFSIGQPFAPRHTSCRCFPRPVVELPDAPPRGRRRRGEQTPIEEPESGEPKPEAYPPGGFKTRAEVEGFMRNRFPETHWSFTGMDTTVMNRVARRLTSLADEWPDVQKKLKYVGTNRDPPAELKRYIARFGKNTYAHATTNGTSISFNPRYFAKDAQLKAYMNRDIVQKFHPDTEIADDYESIVTHEFGHQVMNHFLSREARDARVTMVARADGLGNVYETFRRFMTVYSPRNYVPVSQYALKSQAEWWAETFSVQYHGTAAMRANAYVQAQARLLQSLHTQNWRTGGDLQWVSDLTRGGPAFERALEQLRELNTFLGLDFS